MSAERPSEDSDSGLDINPSDLEILDHNSIETPADKILDGIEYDDTSVGPDDGDGLGKSGPHGSDDD